MFTPLLPSPLTSRSSNASFLRECNASFVRECNVSLFEFCLSPKTTSRDDCKTFQKKYRTGFGHTYAGRVILPALRRKGEQERAMRIQRGLVPEAFQLAPISLQLRLLFKANLSPLYYVRNAKTRGTAVKFRRKQRCVLLFLYFSFFFNFNFSTT